MVFQVHKPWFNLYYPLESIDFRDMVPLILNFSSPLRDSPKDRIKFEFNKNWINFLVKT
jgi:hypothetical protein